MIKRSESESATKSRPRRSQRDRRRRLLVEGLEQRQLLAAGVIPTSPIIDLPSYTAPRNLGSVPSFAVFETESATQVGLNDSFQTAQVLPLGNLPGQQSTIDLVGSADFTFNPITGIVQTDIDVYAVDLRAGDIFDIAVHGSISQISVHGSDGRFLFGTDENLGIFGYSANSPLQTQGNAVMAQVVPEDGRYYIVGAPSFSGLSSYTYSLRTYRPVTESLPIGAQQILFIDFDGGFYPASMFSRFLPVPGIVRIPSLQETLPLVGVEEADTATMNRLIDGILAEVNLHFRSIANNGTNGDYQTTGIPGQYGITILNSRDHADPGLNHPLVTRALVGGTTALIGIDDILGVAPSGDVGNFDLSEIFLSPLDLVLDYSTQFPIAAGASVLDAVARTIAVTVSHEAAHVFGIEHTDGTNLVPSLVDGPGPLVPAFDMGVGPDGIFGTLDDTPIEFVTDRFALDEGYLGTQFVPAALSHVLSTGRSGGLVSGRVFNDLNRDGRGTNDPGLSGVTVFADINGNGVLDTTEPRAVTGDDGTFALSVPPGTFNIIAQAPSQFAGTTALVQSATVALGGTAAGLSFGMTQVRSDITGTKFADLDGDGIFDTNEPGLAGVYIYIDLDRDGRPDVGEPGAFTDANGNYSLNFPGPGIYTIREVIEPGFVQTKPTSGAYTVVYDGTSLIVYDATSVPTTQAARDAARRAAPDFGNRPARDFGDAPDSYRTTIAAGGPSHGLMPGLSIGTHVDAELDGQPSVGADGDDRDGPLDLSGNVIDDEDGFRQLTPLTPGETGLIEVTLTNETGSTAYLQGWIDFNGDGSFLRPDGSVDPTEQILKNRVLGTGTHVIPVNVPASAVVGTTYLRLRYSLTPDLGVGGPAATGEVEDHLITIFSGGNVANDDEVTVSRNSLSNRLDVLANDFQTPENPLIITNLLVNGTGSDFTELPNLPVTRGQVRIANDGKSVDYTPPNGFIGRDSFGYVVRDSFGQTYVARVDVTVTFQSSVPIAVDDTFEVPQGSSNRALNVLDNDVPSVAGGISIISVTPGNAGGTISIVGGGQSLRYTPAPGFNGTEQFTYSIQDANGAASTATVTVNLLPGSRNDDLVDFKIELIDLTNQRVVDNVQVGQRFGVRVSVEDLRPENDPLFDPFVVQGVVSAFLDLLYTDELVVPFDSGVNPNFPFDITFGPLFTGSNLFQSGDAQIPGLLNEIGGTQPIGNQQEHTDATVLFTVTMQAVSPGVAIFQADPADDPTSETVLFGQDTALAVNRQRLGRTELLIAPASDNFTAAVDDSFPDGRDSNGNLITATSPNPAILRVLRNDNLGPTGVIQEFGIVTAPSLGNVVINDNGTPGNLNDDFLEYRPNLNARGFDQFTYVIVTADGIRSTAEVTMSIGDIDDYLAAFDFALVNESGAPIDPATGVRVGDRFGVQVYVEDLRIPINATYVFAGFLDIMYDAGIIRPTDTISGDNFDFDVEFVESVFNRAAAVGTAATPGIIDEFGTLMLQGVAESGGAGNPTLMATLFFTADTTGTARITGGPADAFPFQDTLLFGQDNPVPVSRIRYDSLSINVRGPEPEAPLHNRALPADVNGDGYVTAIDALLVINRLGRKHAEAEVSLNPGAETIYYVDVNGDNRLTASDALTVINYLNVAAANRALGEFVPALPLATADSGSVTTNAALDTDAVFADLSTADLLADTPVSPSFSESRLSVAVHQSSPDDDDEEALLETLAGDVSAMWVL